MARNGLKVHAVVSIILLLFLVLGGWGVQRMYESLSDCLTNSCSLKAVSWCAGGLGVLILAISVFIGLPLVVYSQRYSRPPWWIYGMQIIGALLLGLSIICNIYVDIFAP